ncbi:MAG: polyphosphate kinase 1 [Phycisphaeraceae bacterium]|nr:MAG: polyphosphate kinase 1 [Phycisphaeraceae bacterium]
MTTATSKADLPEQEPLQNLPEEEKMLNRELTWLEFNRRVLRLATDDRTPLLERVRFLAIFSSNLDEFFMKRVGGLKRQLEAGVATRSGDGLTPGEQLQAIRDLILELQAEQADCYENSIIPALTEAGIELTPYNSLTTLERERIDDWFRRNVFPLLTPLAVDPGHRFPFISNLSTSIGVLLTHPDQSEQLFARVKVPSAIPRWIPVDPDGSHYSVRMVNLPDLIRYNLDDLFPDMHIVDVMPFRVTRNAEPDREDADIDDLLETIEQELRQRRFARAIRLECWPDASPTLLHFVMDELDLKPQDVYKRLGPLDYSGLSAVADLNRPDLKYEQWNPVTTPRLVDEDADIFSIIRQGDLLVHHPYESFTTSVERFITAAARDPKVLAIKQTLYRTSPSSVFVPEMIRAAESGKQVACLVELRARFDESTNIQMAQLLEKAGVHVAYGVVGLKTHCKLALVVRQEADGLRTYAHIGTGNYNSRTARLYTDVGLLTCDPAITEDVVNLFNYLTGRSRKKEYNRLLVAPVSMRRRFNDMIDREIEIAKAGGRGRIIAKMNSMEDRQISERLYEASQAGVQIDLIVRGFCCLRPGVPGVSDNIRVISVIGRFLEHSRIFHFGAGKDDPLDGEWFINSGDWMVRNLNYRVEAAAPVLNRDLRKRLKAILDVALDDHLCAWDMQPDGTYTQRMPPKDADPASPAAIGSFEWHIRDTLTSQPSEAL